MMRYYRRALIAVNKASARPIVPRKFAQSHHGNTGRVSRITSSEEQCLHQNLILVQVKSILEQKEIMVLVR